MSKNMLTKIKTRTKKKNVKPEQKQPAPTPVEEKPVSPPPRKDQPRFNIVVRNAVTNKTTMKVSNVTQSHLEQYIYPLLDLAQSS